MNEKGEHHSFDDKPSIVSKNGFKWWHQNGQMHRENDKPAYVSKDEQKWYTHGKKHRVGAPAHKQYRPYTRDLISSHWYWEGKKSVKFHEQKNRITKVWDSGARTFSEKIGKELFDFLIIEEFPSENSRVFLCIVNGTQKVYCVVGRWMSQA